MKAKVGAEKQFPYLFILPAMLIVIALIICPIFYSFHLSLNKPELGTGILKFVGVNNFIRILKGTDFLESLKNTLVFVLPYVCLTMFVGLLFALLLNKKYKLGRLYMAIIFIPWIISQVPAGVAWRWMFNAELGVMQHLLLCLNLVSTIRGVLGDPVLSMVLMVIASSWKWVAFTMIYFLAGLQTIDPEIYESAQIDGAKGFQIFHYITFPLIRSIFLVLFLLLTIGGINRIGLFMVITGGGPFRATETLSLYMYKLGFEYFHITEGAVVTIVLLFINTIFIVIYFPMFKMKK